MLGDGCNGAAGYENGFLIFDGSIVATKRPGHRFVAAAAEADVAARPLLIMARAVAAHGDEHGVPALETRGGVINVASNLQANRSVNSKQRGKEQKWG
jgi:hypothetical protein